LADPTLRARAPTLCDMALEGCAALGDDFVEQADLERTAEYFDRYTRRGLSPADE